MEVWGVRKGKMEEKMEVYTMELYYSAKNCFCEYKKRIVCGNVTDTLEHNILILLSYIKYSWVDKLVLQTFVHNGAFLS